MNISKQQILEEERIFYERYRQNEIKNYRNITIIGSLTKFILARIYQGKNNDSKDNVYKLEQFWDNFLMNNTTMVVFIHSANILLLIVTVIFLCDWQPISYSILWNCFIWIVISVLCLLFIIWYKSSKTKVLGLRTQKKALQLWTNVGYFILYLRLLKLVAKITETTILEIVGLKSSNPDDASLEHVVLSIAIDFVQLVVFSTVPFPTPINFYITLQEFAVQVLKVLIIKKYISNSVLGRYLFVCTLITIFNWHMLIMMTVIIVENTEKATYKNLRTLKASSSDKNRLINLICSDTKSIMKDLGKAVANINNNCIDADTGNKIGSVTNIILKEAEIVHIVADNLLLLTRINDGNWKSRDSLVNLNDLIGKVRNDESFKNLKVRFKINVMTEIERDIIADADSISIMLRNSLFYWYQSNHTNYFSGYKLIALQITCKLVKIKHRSNKQKHMVIFHISKEKRAGSENFLSVSIATKLKSRRKIVMKSYMAESNIASLMNLAASKEGYCEIDEDDTLNHIEFGIICTGLSSELIINKANDLHASQDTEFTAAQNDLISAISSDIVKNNTISDLKVFVIADDYIKSQKVIKLLECIGVNTKNITASKSLNPSSTSISSPPLLKSNKHHDLLSSSDIVLIDSIKNCENLAAIGTYFGLVVLITDFATEVHDVGEIGKKLYHYCLPLYSLNTEVMNFKKWLGESVCKDMEPVLSHPPTPKIALRDVVARTFMDCCRSVCQVFSTVDKANSANSDADKIESEYIFKHNSYKSSVKITNAHRKFDFTTSFFSTAVEETYRKIKILNFTSCWIHPNTTFYWIACVYACHALMIQFVGVYYFPAVPFRLYKGVFFGVAIPFCYFKDNFFLLLQRRLKVTAITYATVWGFILVIAWNVFPLIIYFLVYRHGKLVVNNPFTLQSKAPGSIDQFYTRFFNGYAGREYIDHIFIYSIYLIGAFAFSLYLQWPFNVLLPLLCWVQLCFFSSSVVYELLILKMIEIEFIYTIALILVTFGVLVLISLVHFEWMNRSNYQIFRRVMECNDFIYDCYKFCHNDLVAPMKRITDCHQQILSSLLPLVLKKKITLTSFLKDNIDSFNMQNILIDLLLVDLSSKKTLSNSYNDTPTNPDGTYAEVVPISLHEETNNEYKDENKYSNDGFDALDCDIVYLKSEIQEISAIINAYYNKNDFAIKIFTDIDDTLSIVRANKKILRILITNAILNSIAILKQEMHLDDTAPGSWHEIVITVEPRRTMNDNLRFTELRWMRIAVRDSRSIQSHESGPVCSLLNYVQYKSREVIEMLSKFDTDPTPWGKNGAKPISLPYKFHPCHSEVLQIVNKAKKMKLKVMGIDGLFDRYKQWSKSNNARPYSILIIQYIPDDQNMLLLQLLRARGWVVELVSSIRVIEFNPNNLNCDCIVVDYSRYDQIKKKSINLLDEISIIKLFGFKGILS